MWRNPTEPLLGGDEVVEQMHGSRIVGVGNVAG